MLDVPARPRVRRVAVATSLLAVLALLIVAPASATNVRVRHQLFGTHDRTLGTTSLATIHEGAVRLWDVGVRWDQVQTGRHHYDWTRLDALVSAAEAAHAEIAMVVAMTPHFYAKRPTDPPRHLAAYKRFVRKLMKRYPYRGGTGIAAYQVWNEVNVSAFWTGSLHRLAQLTRAMAQVRDSVDPRAKVIAPPMVTRLRFELVGLSSYYHQRIGGRPIWKYVDAVALSLYPLPKYGRRTGVPEDAIKQLKAVKRRLRQAGVPASTPIWTTEVNYGLKTGDSVGSAAPPISAARQAANVMRTYLLNAANGVKRVFWYRYDWGNPPTAANTVLTDPSDLTQLTPAGHAYLRIQQWMHGTLLGTRRARPCQSDRQGTYTCVVKDSTGTRYIYWNPFHKAKVRLPGHVHHLTREFGGESTVTPHARLKVDYRPVLVSR